jgi:thioredoxin 1
MAGVDTFNVSDAEFKTTVLESQEPVLVDFWAPWWAVQGDRPGARRAGHPLPGKMKVAKLNVDENQETAQNYGVRSIPMLLVFKGEGRGPDPRRRPQEQARGELQEARLSGGAPSTWRSARGRWAR